MIYLQTSMFLQIIIFKGQKDLVIRNRFIIRKGKKWTRVRTKMTSKDTYTNTLLQFSRAGKRGTSFSRTKSWCTKRQKSSCTRMESSTSIILRYTSLQTLRINCNFKSKSRALIESFNLRQKMRQSVSTGKRL